jgi:hypothetical protein
MADCELMISVVVPVFNERETIDEILRRIETVRFERKSLSSTTDQEMEQSRSCAVSKALEQFQRRDTF